MNYSMKTRFRPTLAQTFALSLLGLLALLAFLFLAVMDGSRRSVLQSSERLRDEASREIVARVSAYLEQAPAALRYLEEDIRYGIIDAANPRSLEAGLFSLLLSNPEIAEVALTYGRRTGFDEEGNSVLAAEGRGQIVVSRASDGRIQTRMIESGEGGFVCRLRDLGGRKEFRSRLAGAETIEKAADPTEHLTFVTPASKRFEGRLLWSDLHWSQRDEAVPESQREARVSVQKAIQASEGEFLGVLRVALSARQIDRIGQIKLGGGARSEGAAEGAAKGGKDPHRVFLTDPQGRLITRLAPGDELKDMDGDLRVVSKSMTPEIEKALASLAEKELTGEGAVLSQRIPSPGGDHLATFRALGETQDWVVGIVVPESFYLGGLMETRDRLLLVCLAVALVIAAAGTLLLRSVRREQSLIIGETERMNRFEFQPSSHRSFFRDVNASLESLEKAKAAMRAMGKYAPLDLVRQLYQSKAEPVLGGEATRVSLMFTDIADFTTISEKLPPNELAQALGVYLDRMVDIIQNRHHGTIDKFIGDAIMAFWNAPLRLEDDAVRACRSALDCRAGLEKLFASPEWQGLPPFHTRFGLHKDSVMVGHFGAPDRMNYTAIGDGVNLASRLEGLNKQYGTFIIASEAVQAEAKGAFVFRRLDTVAVKGKSRGVGIFELVGDTTSVSPGLRATIEAYERAFSLYQKREFAAASALLEPLAATDGPSEMLLERCREYLAVPPPAEWDGSHSSRHK